MAVTRIGQSTIKQGLKKNETFTAGIPPILGKFYHMGTVEVGAGGASSIEFTGIPAIYKHLQVRMVARGDTALAEVGGAGRINGITTNSYSSHRLYGSGTAASADGAANMSVFDAGSWPAASATAGMFGASIIDILDYASTSKNTTVRCFYGDDRNGAGYVFVTSGLLHSTTAAVSSLTLLTVAGGFAQYSTAALYGVK